MLRYNLFFQWKIANYIKGKYVLLHPGFQLDLELGKAADAGDVQGELVPGSYRPPSVGLKV